MAHGKTACMIRSLPAGEVRAGLPPGAVHGLHPNSNVGIAGQLVGEVEGLLSEHGSQWFELEES